MKNNSSVFFLAQTSYTLDKIVHQSEIFGLLSGWVKLHQIPHVIFETTSQFFFKLCITLQCHERYVFCTFFSWSFIWFLQKEYTKVRICTLIGSFCWKYIKFQLKRYIVVMSHDTEEWCKIWRKNWFFVLKMPRIWWIMIRALKSLKHLHFVWSLSCKVYNIWPKKVQRRYISWHWRDIHSLLKKKWLVVSKMTWRIWQIFIRTPESVKIGTFMGSFCSN